ncbi:MAG TPA: class I SAM-dependent methyltransferase [Candidatus Saccharimonadales bacterium]|jgi:ubiquinone/menaquinone biosynthesis C-methylase UbiE|nr:class I SAM-dependent methyltransferase [Candidatus Saccharimonadales bacterium]
MPLFDATAAQFDLHRAFPEGIAEAIRRAVWSSVKVDHPARVLDLGAGTGRIGRAFVAAHDAYFGADLSLGMLQEFKASMVEATPVLVQADGDRLPFPGETFAIVMLIQVLSGVEDWRGLLSEVRRVLRPGGYIIAGHTAMPGEGVDRRMKARLNEILERMGVESRRGRHRRDAALVWLEEHARHHRHCVPASWKAERTPRQFLARHRTGAQFSALPLETQAAALDELTDWAFAEFQSLDAVFHQQHSFELDIFEF